MAAGSSSRLGSPKQLLPWKNTSLIANEIEKSLKLKNLETLVVLGAHFEIILKEIKHFPVVILHNKNWELGMGASISFGIQQILKYKENFEGVLITLVDQPLIDEEHLNNLISKFNENQDAIIATSMKDRIGVPAIFARHYFKELLLLKEDYGARQIIKKHESHIINIDGKDKTDDIDTKEQYKALLERVKQ
ncbi:nucleotidyltransferase family protein [uncultured Aquimarina sp.]|uniref:nucleotidyltransferase family protein n=1 Tax=uncultured Aquimarina sp. TaxID=575652 RepID=UPI0026295715|nr:nucleotidyltransferase family protein [uncultured Aquimarina sp.]